MKILNFNDFCNESSQAFDDYENIVNEFEQYFDDCLNYINVDENTKMKMGRTWKYDVDSIL